MRRSRDALCSLLLSYLAPDMYEEWLVATLDYVAKHDELVLESCSWCRGVTGYRWFSCRGRTCRTRTPSVSTMRRSARILDASSCAMFLKPTATNSSASSFTKRSLGLGFLLLYISRERWRTLPAYVARKAYFSAVGAR